MGALVGQIVSRNARIYRENKSHFLAAVPPGLRPEDALVAQTDLTFHDGNGGVRKIWAGQWVDRADPAVQVQWPHFAPVPREAVRTS